jgi:general secretion pathway protein D
MMRLLRSAGLVALVVLAGGCAANKALRQGNAASKSGNYDQAVAFYRSAVQAAPNNPNYKIALERAMLVASRVHLDHAKDYEDHDQLEAARSEYKLASEYDPSNGYAGLKIAALDQRIRARIEANRPHPMDELRERARAASPTPLLNPAAREQIGFHYNNARLGDILSAIGNASGINVTLDTDPAAQQVFNRGITFNTDGLTVEQALNQLTNMNQLSFKVLNDRAVLVFQDTAQKHTQFDDQLIKTFYVANADATELSQTISGIVRFNAFTSIQPIVIANKTANTITVRSTPAIVDIVEKMIQQNDKPKAEIMLDVEIMEVNRARTKQYGLNLSQYAVGGIFSPEVSPGAATAASTTTTTPTTGTSPTTSGTSVTVGRSTPPDQVASPPPFNLNTISQGVSTTDFYLAVPTAIARFLESDSQTKLIAKPQFRGSEGQKMSLHLGSKVPLPSTTFTPIATGGATTNPLTTFTYTDVGVNIDMTPRVTIDGDILLEMHVDDSALGTNITVNGITAPTIQQRTVDTRLRLRDGESNLLAGLLQEEEDKAIQGFPGAIHVPILSQLFSGNSNTKNQTDIVMLITPHVIRTNEITADDLKGLYIGSQTNLGVGGPPPLISVPADQSQAPAAQAPAPQGTQQTVPGGTLITPPGSSPVPGTIFVPNPPPPGQAQDAPAFTRPSPSAAEPRPAPTQASQAQPLAAPLPAQAAVQSTTQEVPPTAAAVAAAAATQPPPVVGSAQVIITPPGTTFRVGAGPYTVPISVVDASRLSMITLTLTFDPNVLRVRSVQDGSFMRTGGANAVFTNQVGNGRIDITIARSADATGASGTGLLGAVLFDAIAPGAAPLTLSGAGTGPAGTPMGLQFRPVTVTVQ